MPRITHPIHPFGTYFLHGDGQPRPVRILGFGTRTWKPGKVHVHDGHTRYWIPREALKRTAKPARRPRPAPYWPVKGPRR